MLRRSLILLALCTLSTPTAAEDLRVQTVDGQPAEPRPFELSEADAQPAPAPEARDAQGHPILRREDSGQSHGPLEMVRYNLRTRVEERRPATRAGSELAHFRTRGGEPGAIFPSGPGQETNKDFTGLTLITTPDLGIYPRHVRITMDFMTQGGMLLNRMCSGTLIDPMHVVTAAHCIYSEQDDNGNAIDDWAFNVVVQPGYDNGVSFLGTANGVDLLTWTGWTDDFDYDHDVGMITLDRPVGALTGWRGFGWNNNFDYYETGTWIRHSYPGSDHYGNQVYDSQRMYLNVGTFDYDDDEQVGFKRDMYRGTSGSGAVRDGAVYAVRSHAELGDGYNDSWDTRLTSTKVNDMLSHIAADKPNTYDLVALDVEVGETGDQVGNLIDGLSFLAHNYSEATFNGTVYYTVYLSVNTTISTSDVYVTSGSASVNLSPLASTRINVGPTAIVPQISTPTNGQAYTLGVIITNNDANTSNNDTQGADTEPYVVVCQTQGSPVLVNPDNNHPCVPTTVTLDWGSVPGVGTTYELQVGLTPGTGTVYPTNITQHLVQNLQEGTVYYWRVRALSNCGAAGNWSAPFSFQTEGQLNDISRHDPAPDQGCLDTTVTFTWDTIPAATYYRVWIMDLEFSNHYYVDSSGSSAQYSGLVPGREYHWAIKGRDACGQWGNYGERSAFRIKGSGGTGTTPTSPAPGQFLLDEVELRTLADPNVLRTEFEVQQIDGTPAYQQTVFGQALDLLSVAEGEYRWRARSEFCTTGGDAFGPWTAWETFTVDLTAPAFTLPPYSTSHTVSTWSPFPTVNFDWNATDAGSGVAEYWILGDTSPTTTPDNTNASTGTGGEWSFGDGPDNWFHVVAVDHVGNVSAPMHVGPFWIDLGPPTDPVLTPAYAEDDWLNATNLAMSWEPSTDQGSGVAGYSVAWTTGSTHILNDTIETTGTGINVVNLPEGWNYFHIKALDNFGNASPQQTFRVGIDRTAPVLELWNPNGGEVLTSGATHQIQFNANDNIAGPNWMDYEHAYSVDGGASWYEIRFCPLTNCGGGWQGTPWNSHWKVPWVPPGSQVLYRVAALDDAGNRGEAISQNWFTILVSTGIGDTPPGSFQLAPNSPNPFNPRTTIRYAVPGSADVRLAIYDLRGRLVRTLVQDHQDGPAWYEQVWDGKSDAGEQVSSGVYVYRLDAGSFSESRRMTLLK